MAGPGWQQREGKMEESGGKRIWAPGECAHLTHGLYVAGVMIEERGHSLYEEHMLSFPISPQAPNQRPTQCGVPRRQAGPPAGRPGTPRSRSFCP